MHHWILFLAVMVPFLSWGAIMGPSYPGASLENLLFILSPKVIITCFGEHFIDVIFFTFPKAKDFYIWRRHVHPWFGLLMSCMKMDGSYSFFWSAIVKIFSWFLSGFLSLLGFSATLSNGRCLDLNIFSILFLEVQNSSVLCSHDQWHLQYLVGSKYFNCLRDLVSSLILGRLIFPLARSRSRAWV